MSTTSYSCIPPKKKSKPSEQPYHPLNQFLAGENTLLAQENHLLKLQLQSMKEQLEQADVIIRRRSRTILRREEDLVFANQATLMAMRQARAFEDVALELQRVGERMASQNKVLKAAYNMRESTYTLSYGLIRSHLMGAGILTNEEWPNTIAMLRDREPAPETDLEAVEEIGEDEI